MQVEECCRALLAMILPNIDKDRKGWAIDIGVGTFAFYCELFDKLDFPTVAVEPLPTVALRKLCCIRDIQFIEGCISDIDGLVDLYVGNFQGNENWDLNTLRPDWWGASEHIIKINSMILSSLLERIKIEHISCMKIDIEGKEYSVIKQLQTLNISMLPKVLMFEYGGGACKESGYGGWQEEILNETISSLEILRKLGYEQSIFIDSAVGTREKSI